jgi:hypothetical protein
VLFLVTFAARNGCCTEITRRVAGDITGALKIEDALLTRNASIFLSKYFDNNLDDTWTSR